MSEYKFYLFEKGKEPEKIEEGSFLSKYSNAYFGEGSDSAYIPRLHKSNKLVEEKVCKLIESIQTDKPSLIDIVHIMAWKMGKLKHQDAGEEGLFVYADGWGTEEMWESLDQGSPEEWSGLILPFPKEPKESEDTSGRWVLEIGKLAGYLYENFDSLKEKALRNSPIYFIEDLTKAGIKGFGFVYAVTLLYFFSGGKYPIYDRYAHIALMKIVESNDSADFSGIASVITDNEVEDDLKAKGYKDSYVTYLENIFGDKYKSCRDIDRALWAYGHLFNNTKTNRDRMERLKREGK